MKSSDGPPASFGALFLRLAEQAVRYHYARVKIVCAESVLFGREAFQTLGDVLVVPDTEIRAFHLRDADALIVRSKTRVTAEMLQGGDVGFVGTATAGFDHLDTIFMDESDIAWGSAPGCNADSVAEYVATALLCLAHRHGLLPDKMTLGVIGVGQTGSRVARRAEAIGLNVLLNDPPLQVATGDPGYLDLDEVLARSDAITLHVPLTRTGPYATQRMANCHFFARLKAGSLFVNASRGEVLDEEDLLFALDHGAVSHAVLDVWSCEPRFSKKLLDRADLGTPHIAGWSYEGRLNGTLQVYREACHFFEVDPAWAPDEGAMPPAPEVKVDARGKSDEEVLWQMARAVYDIEADDRALRAGAAEDEEARGRHFATLREHYAPRREFPAAKVSLSNAPPLLTRKAFDLGFKCL